MASAAIASARMSGRASTWRRRVALMAGLGLALAIVVGLLVDERAESPAPPAPAELGALRFDRDVGVEYRLPEGWRADKRRDVLRLAKGDAGVAVVVAAPGPREDAAAIEREAREVLAEEYDDVRAVTRVRDRRVGGIPADGFVVAARRGGEPLRILTLVGRGDERAYLVQVFAAAEGFDRSLVEAQTMLNELVLEG